MVTTKEGMMNKKISILLAAILLFTSVFVFYTPSTMAISNVWLEVSNRNPGAIPSYTFHLVPGKTIKAHDWIKFTFPKESVIKEPRKEDLKDPTLPPHLGLPIVDYGENSIKFNVHQVYHPGFELVFTIPVNQVIQISNPPNPGLYYFKVSTQAEPTQTKSLPVDIFVTQISVPVLDIEAPLADDIAGYGLDFSTSTYGKLITDERDTKNYSLLFFPTTNQMDHSDEIRVTFPDGFIFTKKEEELKPNWVMINNCFLWSSPKIEGNTLIIKVPTLIGSMEEVSLRIDCRVGIKTPKEGGQYSLLVSTTTDSTGVLSDPFLLK